MDEDSLMRNVLGMPTQNLTGWQTLGGPPGTTDMTSMTTEQRITSCFQRIQGLESRRADIIDAKTIHVQILLDKESPPAIRALSAAVLTNADEALIQLDNQKEALRRLGEHLQGLLAAFPRP